MPLLYSVLPLKCVGFFVLCVLSCLAVHLIYVLQSPDICLSLDLFFVLKTAPTYISVKCSNFSTDSNYTHFQRFISWQSWVGKNINPHPQKMTHDYL